MNASTHPEAATIGTCRHTKHAHGWWCVRCLKGLVPGVSISHWGHAAWGAESPCGAIGYGAQKTHALQACIEAMRAHRGAR